MHKTVISNADINKHCIYCQQILHYFYLLHNPTYQEPWVPSKTTQPRNVFQKGLLNNGRRYPIHLENQHIERYHLDP